MMKLVRPFSGVVRICLLVGLVSLAVSGTVPAIDENGATLQNPVIKTNFPDPFILEVGDEYFAYSTNSNSRNVPVYRSDDLINWEFLRDAMPALASWVDLSDADVWAPEILPLDDQYLLYYTARDDASGRQCIGLAISDAPEGPFRDRNDEPFICQSRQGGSIDASPFRDADGTLYLYWKNDGNCCLLATYIYGQKLTADGLALEGEPVQLVRNDALWEGPVVEAPTMWRHEDQYYLFYSGNVFSTENYAIGYAVCETPLGACEDAEANPILTSDLTAEPQVVGPGHQTIIVDEQGETWLVYHAWQVTGGGRLTSNRYVWMDRLVWDSDQPSVLGPTREVQPAPAA